MWAYLRNVTNIILEKSTGCVKIIYKKFDKPMATDNINPDSDINANASIGGSNWITYTMPAINTYSSTTSAQPGSLNWTIGGGGGGQTSYAGNGTTYTFTNPFSYGTNITKDGLNLDEQADIKIGNRSLKEFMEQVSDRLAILQPDPIKLEKFAALKAAYEHYKMLEKLIGDVEPNPDEK